MIGQMIAHYRILEKLGEGGMGVVYKAVDTALDRFVALKFLPPDLIRDPKARARFVHEAKAASALDHPNLCTIYEINETVEGGLFIAMSCYEGETLKEKVARGPLKLEEAIDIAQQIAQGLSKAHQEEIIHRDIKPGNVFLTADGLVKILDFGLAKLAGQTRMTRTGTVVGTITYMSPEQAVGEQVDQRTDIWSFGALFYEMISGRPPFRGDREQTVLHSILNDEPEPLTGLRTGVPMELEHTVRRCLDRNPAHRYQDAGDLLAHLKSIRSRLADSAPSAGVSAPQRRFTGRQVMLVAIAVAALLGTSLPLVLRNTRSGQSAGSMPRIAVLYLDNLGGTEESDYFVSGMSEDIMTELANISGLLVTSRTEVERYRSQVVDSGEIAERLQVDYILTGSLRMMGSKLRLSSQLVQANSGFSVWADRFDRDVRDVFAVQEEVAQAIARAVKVQLTPVEIDRIERKPTDSLEAYDLYLRGRQFYNRRTNEDNEQAIALFQRAIDLDPEFAEAYIMLGRTYGQRGDWRFDANLDWPDTAEVMIRKGLAIDKDNPDGYAALGDIGRLRGEYKNAIKSFDKAVALRPNHAETLYNSGWSYFFEGDFKSVEDLVRRVFVLSPTDPEPHRLLGWTLLCSGRPDSAGMHLRGAVDLGPDRAHLRNSLGTYYLARGMWVQAQAELQMAVQLEPGSPRYLTNLGWAEFYAGNAAKGREYFAQAAKSDPLPSSRFGLGCIESRLGNKNEAADAFGLALPGYEDIVRRNPKLLDEHVVLAFLLGALGRTTAARERLDIAEARLPGESILEQRRTTMAFAAAFMVMGDTASALHYVGRARQDNYYGRPAIMAHYGLEGLQSTPEFIRLLDSAAE